MPRMVQMLSFDHAFPFPRLLSARNGSRPGFRYGSAPESACKILVICYVSTSLSGRWPVYLNAGPKAKFIGFLSKGLRYRAIQIRRSFQPPTFRPPPQIELLAARALHRFGETHYVKKATVKETAEKAAPIRSRRDCNRSDCFTSAHLGHHHDRSTQHWKGHWPPSAFRLCSLHYDLCFDGLPAHAPQR